MPNQCPVKESFLYNVYMILETNDSFLIYNILNIEYSEGEFAF